MSDQNNTSNSNEIHYEGDLPIFKRLGEVERKQAEAETREQKYREQQLSINRSVMWFTGALVFLSFLTIVVNGIYTYITNKSADAAKNAATTAHDSFQFSQRQFRTEQRPYLAPSPRPGFEHKETHETRPFIFYSNTKRWEFLLNVDLINIGKSPAVNVGHSDTICIFGEKNKARDFARHWSTGYGSTPSTVLMNAFVTPVANGIPMKDEQHKLFLNGEWELYVVGGVRYTDIFSPPLEQPYETTYCYHIKPEGMMYGNCSWSPPDFAASIK